MFYNNASWHGIYKHLYGNFLQQMSDKLSINGPEMTIGHFGVLA